MQILNERPEDMSFNDYKAHLKKQSKWIRDKKRGVLCYVATEIVHFNQFKEFGYRQTYPPFKGNSENLTKIVNENV